MKTIKLSSIILAFLLVAGTSLMAGCDHVITGEKGNGKVIKQNREVNGFSSLEVGGAFTVYLSQGDKESLVVEADENLMELIVTEVHGDRLEIHTRGKGIRDYTKMNIYLTFKSLEMIDISGAVNVFGEGVLRFDELDFEGSGASELDMEMEVAMLEADFSGASDISLRGKAGSARFDCSGASSIDAIDFVAENCEMDVSGASDVKIHVTDYLSVDVSGAATVKYKGSPKVESDISGAGSLKSY